MSKVEINQHDVEKLKELAYRIIEAKQSEEVHQRDNMQEEERWLTGLMGERAVEMLTGLDIIDWTVGDSLKYAIPDLKNAGYELGIKTVKKGNSCPLIPRHNKTAQIICVRDGNTIEVKGIATAKILNDYQDDSKVKDPRALDRKTAFTGMEHLLDIKYITMFQI